MWRQVGSVQGDAKKPLTRASVSCVNALLTRPTMPYTHAPLAERRSRKTISGFLTRVGHNQRQKAEAWPFGSRFFALFACVRTGARASLVERPAAEAKHANFLSVRNTTVNGEPRFESLFKRLPHSGAVAF